MKNVLPLVCAALVLCGLHAPGYAQYRTAPEPTLRDLSPVQVYAVPDVSSPPPVALPGQFPFTGLLPPSYTYSPGLGLRLPDATGAGAMPAVPSLGSGSGSSDSLSLGSQNWRYVSSSGYGLMLGSGPSQAPPWSQPVRLAGVGVYRSPLDASGRGSPWQYAASFGALDESPDAATATQGGLSYGPAASNTSLRYTAGPDLALDSQVQWARDLLAVGMGGTYSMQDWGAWNLGVSRGTWAAQNGWLYRLGYQVDVSRDLQLSWTGEQRGAGYSDLSTYGGVTTIGPSVSNQWQASIPMGRWGDLSGTYAQVDGATGVLQQTFGLSQQFWYSPHLQVQLKANRDIVTGDYGLGMELSLPLQ